MGQTAILYHVRIRNKSVAEIACENLPYLDVIPCRESSI